MNSPPSLREWAYVRPSPTAAWNLAVRIHAASAGAVSPLPTAVSDAEPTTCGFSRETATSRSSPHSLRVAAGIANPVVEHHLVTRGRSAAASRRSISRKMTRRHRFRSWISCSCSRVDSVLLPS